MKNHILPALRVLLLLSLITGIAYPWLITAVAQGAFPSQANGSLVVLNNGTRGSLLLAQSFSGDQYFHPRPSAVAYATIPSGASQAGPTSAALRKEIDRRRAEILALEKPAAGVTVPEDLLMASGSGLDPHISPEAARFQAPRIARVRGIEKQVMLDLIVRLGEGPQGGFLGEPRVNVLKLNLALDAAKSDIP